jgi:hypothetical protein
MEPELEPQGVETFGRSWYTEVSAPALDQTKVVVKSLFMLNRIKKVN